MNVKRVMYSKAFWVPAVFLAALLLTPMIAGAAGTPAGTVISNAATVNYQDANLNNYSQVSNTTTVTVSPVYGVLLTDPGDKSGVPLDNVSYGYRIMNTGNATDNYALTASTVGGWTTNLYVDTNQDGIHQSGEPAVSSPITINADDNTYIVVVVTIPAGTPNGTTALTTLNVTGTGIVGAFPDGDDATDGSTTTVRAPILSVAKGVLNVTLGESSYGASTTAAPTQTLEYRITVTNNGTDNAVLVVLTDPDNANTTYVAGSMRIGPSNTYGGAQNLNPGDGNADSAFPMPCVAAACGHGHVTGGNVTAYLGNGANDGATGPGGTLIPTQTIYVYFRVTVD